MSLRRRTRQRGPRPRKPPRARACARAQRPRRSRRPLGGRLWRGRGTRSRWVFVRVCVWGGGAWVCVCVRACAHTLDGEDVCGGGRARVRVVRPCTHAIKLLLSQAHIHIHSHTHTYSHTRTHAHTHTQAGSQLLEMCEWQEARGVSEGPAHAWLNGMRVSDGVSWVRHLN